ncbi:MAG TPA: hypothetical protein VHB79_08375 [Polyangiaceae bacterium]|nr:hypothetical protein [Polyangiaceae bacterium]
MSVGRRGRFLACAAVGLVLASSSARAEYHRRVLLLEHQAGDDADRELLTRVRAELSAAGFDVSVLAVPGDDPKQAVEAAGHELHPASVLLVERIPASSENREGFIELWLADRLLHKTVVLRLKPPEAEPGEANRADAASQQAARVAVQAVELVKARLAELSLTRDDRAAPAASAPPRPVSPPAPAGARPNLTLGGGMLEGFQAGQHSLTPVLRLGVSLPEGWTGQVLALDLRGGFVGLGRSAHIRRGAGSATLRHTAAGLDAVMRFLPKAQVQPWLALGGGALVLDVAGTAPEPYRNDSARTVSGMVSASAGVWLQPVRGFGLALEAQLMNAWSKTVVRIAGEDAAEVAAPLLLLSGGAMVEF